jgi:hypothetical protein
MERGWRALSDDAQHWAFWVTLAVAVATAVAAGVYWNWWSYVWNVPPPIRGVIVLAAAVLAFVLVFFISFIGHSYFGFPREHPFRQPLRSMRARTTRENHSEANSLVADYAQLVSERDALRRELDETKAARDEAEEWLMEGQRKWARERMELYSNVLINGEKPKLTIRFADYASSDPLIVRKIEQNFKEFTKWDVQVEQATKPALRPDEKFKVVFDIGRSGMAFARIATAFSDGSFAGVPVGIRHSDRTDEHHLIIEVLPTVRE